MIIKDKILNFFKQIFGYCPQHGWFKFPVGYRQNTAYVNDEMNFSIGCDDCQKETHEYWKERWSDYYSGLL